MSTDRELLELAAKAAGISGRWVTNFDGDYYYQGNTEGIYFDYPQGGSTVWNPLTDDGDALRLAVQCGMEVSFVDDEPDRDGRDTRACAGYVTEGDPRFKYVFEDHRGNIFAATRRAIVRAAAETGRAMP